ncbi:FAD-dependent oxidoreductase [Roseinatronobacter alkalisoli]|uniref:FAD-dependent oxidoreductase n=1 Tax=Roseinatronobacter alkalisoli TaxID=3028235 RepID=A0ABT5T5J2_9RHOB|nr:FAD-dependent oxidoreductase [Roseinatronobacter sp. HJB301]MDD7970234.1 FAD-dependent oxidoreductase [Roseinatronobacter sp. HJB301]
MNDPQSRPTELVLVGGGHAHALVLHELARNPLHGTNITLINPSPTAPYTGMLPGFIAGHYAREDLEIDLQQLAARAGARLVLGKVDALDRQAGVVRGVGTGAIRFDIAALDIGITSDLPMIAGYAPHAVSAKPLGEYARRWQDWLDKVRAGQIAPEIAVLGAGVAGVELALAMSFRLRGHPHRMRIIDRGQALPHIGTYARKRLLSHLARFGIAVLEHTEVTGIEADHLRCADGQVIAASFVVGVAGARPQDWLRATGLDHADGFIKVDQYLRSLSDDRIFAVGDCAHMTHAPRPKAGVFAVRQAPFLLANLRAALGGGAWRAYKPQRDYLKLVSLGGKTALADKWGLPLEGRWLWQLKDGIDARFMRQFGLRDSDQPSRSPG